MPTNVISVFEPDPHDADSGIGTSKFLAGPGVPGLVSVVIPSYNRAHLIGSTVDSVLSQSYKQVEIIVVDDGSVDATRQALEQYGPSVRYIYQKNAGVCSARNTGFRHARGEFIALLDSDDRWMPWKLEAQIRLFRQHPEVGMIWTDMVAEDEHGHILDQRYLRKFYDAHEQARLEDVFTHTGAVSNAWRDAPAEAGTAMFYKGDIFSQMLLGNLVHTSTTVLRRDRLRQVGEFDVGLKHTGEDYEFHWRTCSYGPVGLLDASSIYYRVGAADQLTAPHLGIFRARNNLTTVLRWLERGQGRINLPQRMVNERLAQAYAWVGEGELEYGSWTRARENFRKSLRYRARPSRCLMLFLFTLFPKPLFNAARGLKRRVFSRRRE